MGRESNARRNGSTLNYLRDVFCVRLVEIVIGVVNMAVKSGETWRRNAACVTPHRAELTGQHTVLRSPAMSCKS